MKIIEAILALIATHNAGARALLTLIHAFSEDEHKEFHETIIDHPESAAVFEALDSAGVAVPLKLKSVVEAVESVSQLEFDVKSFLGDEVVETE